MALVLTLVLAELGLRALGQGPWTPFETFATLPRMSDPHPALGWVNRPGDHLQPTGEGPVRVHIAADGSRGPPPTAGGTPVDLYGGSFVFGFGLPDDQTLGARLAALRPDLAVRDRAVPGYGTLQSLLAYERGPREPGFVVYGLVELHDGRNVGARSWRHALDRASRGQAWAAPPSARWDGTELIFTPPLPWRHSPAAEHLALADAAERAWIGLLDRGLRTKSETTVQLVRAFRDRVEGDGGRFVVALLEAPTRAAFYQRRLAAEGVALLDLRDADRPDRALPDGHPDALSQDRWARALAAVLPTSRDTTEDPASTPMNAGSARPAPQNE